MNMNTVDKGILVRQSIGVISKIKDLQTAINRLPISVKKDENGVSQKDKRALIQRLDIIYRELLHLRNNIEEES